MKVVHPDYETVFSYEDGGCSEWIIEDAAYFTSVCTELIQMSENGDGKFVVSENDKIYDFAKIVNVITDVLSINVNDRKVLNKIYTVLKNIAASSDFFMQTEELMSKLRMLLYSYAQSADLDVSIKEDIDYTDIFKAFGIKVENIDDSMYSNIITYIKLLTELMNMKLFVFINLRCFLTSEEISNFVSECTYRKYNILLIERSDYGIIDNMHRAVMDKDHCEIF